MKPKPRTIQFLLPTASPGEIELVYRELLGVIGETEPVRGTPPYMTPTGERSEDEQLITAAQNALKANSLQKLKNLFGKEG